MKSRRLASGVNISLARVARCVRWLQMGAEEAQRAHDRLFQAQEAIERQRVSGYKNEYEEGRYCMVLGV